MRRAHRASCRSGRERISLDEEKVKKVEILVQKLEKTLIEPLTVDLQRDLGRNWTAVDCCY